MLRNIEKIFGGRDNVKLTIEDFQLFDREVYTFKQLKEALPASMIEQIKAEYKVRWQSWKSLQLQTAALLPESYQMRKPKVESWTNGWNLRSHFWCAYRSADRENENACLAVLLNKKQFQIYLMFQHYKSEERMGSVEEYNTLLLSLDAWSKHVAIEEYYIWPQLENELTDHLPLAEFLADKEKQVLFKQRMENRTFQIGKLFFKTEDIDDIVAHTTAALEELYPLYFSLSSKGSM